jgi:hypothetical protein
MIKVAILNVIVSSVIMLNVVFPSVIMLNAIMPSNAVMNIVMPMTLPNVIMPNAVMWSVVGTYGTHIDLFHRILLGVVAAEGVLVGTGLGVGKLHYLKQIFEPKEFCLTSIQLQLYIHYRYIRLQNIIYSNPLKIKCLHFYFNEALSATRWQYQSQV